MFEAQVDLKWIHAQLCVWCLDINILFTLYNTMLLLLCLSSALVMYLYGIFISVA